MRYRSKMNVSTVLLLLHVTGSFCSRRNLEKHARERSENWGNPPRVSTKRLYEIYSKVSGRRLQILGKKVDARGDIGGKYAKLEIASRSFYGKITIKGVATGRYLCLSKKGRLFGKRGRASSRCVFIEKIIENKFSAFVSAKNPSRYIAFYRSGKPRRGSRTSKIQNQGMFLKFSSRKIHTSATPPPSGLGDDLWTKIENEYLQRHSSGVRPHIISEPRNLMDRMMGDDPTSPNLTVDPPPYLDQIELGKAFHVTSSPAELMSSRYTSMSSKLSAGKESSETNGYQIEKNINRKNRKRKRKNRRKYRKNRLSNSRTLSSNELHQASVKYEINVKPTIITKFSKGERSRAHYEPPPTTRSQQLPPAWRSHKTKTHNRTNKGRKLRKSRRRGNTKDVT